MRRWLWVLALAAGCAGQPGGAGGDGNGAASTPGVDAPGTDATRALAERSARHGFPLLQHAGDDGLLSPLRLVVVTAPGDPLANELDAFGDAVPTSNWFAAVTAEYGVAAPRPSEHLTGPPLPAGGAPLDRDAVESYVAAALAAASSPPAPDGDTLYLVYLPPGVDLEDNVGCQGPGPSGWHHRYGNGGDGLAVVQRCQGGFESPLQQLTIIGSHEIAEAATDSGPGWRVPIPPSDTPAWKVDPWLSYEESRLTENGDLCIDTRILEGGFWYQRSFSNAAAAAGGDPCVPALTIPYYGATTARPWYAASPGTTVEIPVTGWSVTPTASWKLYARLQNVSDEALGFSAMAGGAALGDGTTATLSVTVPPDAPSGSWAAVYLMSLRRDAEGKTPPEEDFAHLSMVGVYVP